MGKASSKRLSTRHKKKVEKKVREAHRKGRREAKKLRATGGVRKSARDSTTGVMPNSMPHKLELLEQLRLQKAQTKADAAVKANRIGSGQTALMDGGKTSRLLLAQPGAQLRTQAFENAEKAASVLAENPHAKNAPNAELHQEKYIRELRKVVESADVLIEVLDARDPEGTRARSAEKNVMALSGGKKRVILLLNKVDLVPQEVVLKWLGYLRNELPALAFCADTSKRHAPSVAALGSDAVGTDSLLQLLKNYSRNWASGTSKKSSLTVGIIGYPNVGKSSVINAMKRARAAQVGNQPGVTKTAQEFLIDNSLRLLDCPGVIFDTREGAGNSSLVLRNAVRIDALNDPVSHVEQILERVGHESLMQWYALPEFQDSKEFLGMVAKLRGKVGKRGVLDLEGAARVVLTEWNAGKIPFYTLPPSGPSSAHLSAQILSSYGPDFDLSHADTVIKVARTEDEAFNYAIAQSCAMVENEDTDMNEGDAGESRKVGINFLIQQKGAGDSKESKVGKKGHAMSSSYVADQDVMETDTRMDMDRASSRAVAQKNKQPSVVAAQARARPASRSARTETGLFDFSVLRDDDDGS
ncbi:Guanine nucleotide-binding protein-like NSN1 [Porphyridium purpureum]|uniref:Guanine nucleotide-binding protein-like NSN1 n=1 Tax=Porphyridium purpureum TaxID=35688 RepID=A0A5J4YZ04_PORPP|nr:Guanine nucleotide-binding protein-like NSN1 [Porphyridium purpureum]|eukprot:POR5067..scf209_3